MVGLWCICLRKLGCFLLLLNFCVCVRLIVFVVDEFGNYGCVFVLDGSGLVEGSKWGKLDLWLEYEVFKFLFVCFIGVFCNGLVYGGVFVFFVDDVLVFVVVFFV